MQQSGVAAQPSPSTLQRGGAQEPPSQPPEQQSAGSVQGVPSAAQASAHVPPVQASPGQQPSSTQQSVPAGAHAHVPIVQANEQQSACWSQASPSRPHPGPGRNVPPHSQRQPAANRRSGATAAAKASFVMGAAIRP